LLNFSCTMQILNKWAKIVFHITQPALRHCPLPTGQQPLHAHWALSVQERDRESGCSKLRESGVQAAPPDSHSLSLLSLSRACGWRHCKSQQSIDSVYFEVHCCGDNIRRASTEKKRRLVKGANCCLRAALSHMRIVVNYCARVEKGAMSAASLPGGWVGGWAGGRATHLVRPSSAPCHFS